MNADTFICVHLCSSVVKNNRQQLGAINMDKKYENLERNGVISMKTEGISQDEYELSSLTFKVNDFLQLIKESTNKNSDPYLDNLFSEGIKCEVLIPNKNWQEGKVRLSLEFIPDDTKGKEELQSDESTNNESESILDDLRRRIQQSS
jgi:hypothetical protein